MSDAFRNVLRARRLMSEGKCPYCERPRNQKAAPAEREELARIISHEAGYDFDSAGPTLQTKFSKAADAIIAAGWRKGSGNA